MLSTNRAYWSHTSVALSTNYGCKGEARSVTSGVGSMGALELVDKFHGGMALTEFYTSYIIELHYGLPNIQSGVIITLGLLYNLRIGCTSHTYKNY